ncbi:MAG: sugar transferase [Actinomycetia bacterium]|nr:sugar transferase [Actinomycetes bacterium]
MYSREILLERVQLAFLRSVGVALAVYASVWVWHHVLSGQDVVPWTIYAGPSILLALITATVMWSVPARDPDSGVRGTLVGIFKGLAVATIIVLVIGFFYRADSYSRGTFLVLIPLAAVVLYVMSLIHVGLLRLFNANADASRRVIVVGNDEHAHRIANALKRQPAYYSVVGYLPQKADGLGSEIEGLDNLGEAADLDAILSEQTVDVVMIAISDAEPEFTQSLMGACMAHGVDWKVVPPMLDLVLDHVEFEYVDGLPLVGQRGSRLVGYNWFLKRTFDFVIASSMLILLSPFLLIAYLSVKLTSRGPAIFEQRRVGLRGRPFTLLKFRTMRVDTSTEIHERATADWILGKEVASSEESSQVHKITNDQRITRVGKVLRATSIDELPQLWNVVRGDMSLVGPRPPIAYEVARYSEWHKRRLDIPPGVTGLWQVSGRNKLTFDEMVDLDIDYMERWTFGLDIEILIKTIPAVVSDRGY